MEVCYVSASRAKGNRLERYVAAKLRDADGSDPEWVGKETPGGRVGVNYHLQVDIISRRFAVECKSRESLGEWPWKLLDGLARWKGKKYTLLVIKKRRRRPLVVIDLEDFCELIGGSDER